MALGTATAYPERRGDGGRHRAPGRRWSRPVRWAGIQMANTSAAAVGPVIGGLLVGFVGWEALFLINVPLALAALLIVRQAAPADEARERGSLAELAPRLGHPGHPGVCRLPAAGDDGLPERRPGLPLVDAGRPDRWWPRCLPGASCASARPFLDLRLLGRNRPLMLVYLGFAVFSSVYYFVFFGLPQLLQEAGGYDPGVVGLLMLPLAAMSVLATPWAVRAMGGSACGGC